MANLDAQERKIEVVTAEINRTTTAINSLPTNDSTLKSHVEYLACRYKERGNRQINLYVDTFAVNRLVREELADKSFKDYEKAVTLFDNISVLKAYLTLPSKTTVKFGSIVLVRLGLLTKKRSTLKIDWKKLALSFL